MTKPDANLDTLHAEERESALTFPCVFPIKIMGRTQDGFAQAVADVVRRHAPDFDPATLTVLRKVYVGTGGTALKVDSRTDMIYLARRGTRPHGEGLLELSLTVAT